MIISLYNLVLFPVGREKEGTDMKVTVRTRVLPYRIVPVQVVARDITSYVVIDGIWMAIANAIGIEIETEIGNGAMIGTEQNPAEDIETRHPVR